MEITKKELELAWTAQCIGRVAETLHRVVVDPTCYSSPNEVVLDSLTTLRTLTEKFENEWALRNENA